MSESKRDPSTDLPTGRNSDLPTGVAGDLHTGRNTDLPTGRDRSTDLHTGVAGLLVAEDGAILTRNGHIQLVPAEAGFYRMEYVEHTESEGRQHIFHHPV